MGQTYGLCPSNEEDKLKLMKVTVKFIREKEGGR
jgi:hypothetical protein